ncbi:XRE family transcriptional regulator [Paraburkholderia hayleyella]|uniref:XRE family transcriptional regulator n=1 Tax=Paraburkholderia hayleyella TaxID=2152889 RepID=UPI001FE9165D|nr:XRE family transcriptional regulator [Paraburkholderia hayleyella]
MVLNARISFRVEAELHAQFMKIAAMQQRPAAQVLREFMRAYVNEARERQNAPANDAISADERRRRENAVNFACASVVLEGFKLSEEEEAHARRFVSGEIQLAEFVRGAVMTEIEESSGSVYTALGMADAEGMLAKAQLATKIGEIIKSRKWSQQQAAGVLGIPQSKLSKMLRGSFRQISEAAMLACLHQLERYEPKTP